MRLRQLAGLGLIGALIVANAGCRRWRNDPCLDKRNDPLLQRRDTFGTPAPADPNDPRFGAGVGIQGGAEVLTPQPYPGDAAPPPNAGVLPPNSSGYGGIIPASPPMTSRTTEEPPLARATPPEKPAPRPLPPDLREPKAASIPPVANPEPSPKPPTIDAFAEPKARVATGRRPDPEGLDWLSANKYRTVLNLRKPGSDDSADREQVNKRGLKYLSLEISPEALTRDLVDQFSKIVNDSAQQPLFVYDKDGPPAGAMWYLHFRLSEKMPDTMARAKAESYGLKTTGDDEQTAWWAAIQLLLKNEQPE